LIDLIITTFHGSVQSILIITALLNIFSPHQRSWHFMIQCSPNKEKRMLPPFSCPEPLHTRGGERIYAITPLTNGYAYCGTIRRPYGVVTLYWYPDGRTQLHAIRLAGLDEYDTLSDDVDEATLLAFERIVQAHQARAA
jgi:hypothetical protein